MSPAEVSLCSGYEASKPPVWRGNVVQEHCVPPENAHQCVLPVRSPIVEMLPDFSLLKPPPLCLFRQNLRGRFRKSCNIPAVSQCHPKPLVLSPLFQICAANLIDGFKSFEWRALQKEGQHSSTKQKLRSICGTWEPSASYTRNRDQGLSAVPWSTRLRRVARNNIPGRRVSTACRDTPCRFHGWFQELELMPKPIQYRKSSWVFQRYDGESLVYLVSDVGVWGFVDMWLK
jgi:hypothetical protein